MKQLTPEMVAYLGTSLAIELSKCKSTEELNVIRNLASQVAATIFTIISQRALIKATEETSSEKTTDNSGSSGSTGSGTTVNTTSSTNDNSSKNKSK